MIWTDGFLEQLAADAELQINKDLSCIFQKFYLQVNKGLSVYTLPSFVKTILWVSWRGRTLDNVSWEEMQFLTPATYFQNIGQKEESSQSRPLYWSLHPTNPYDIRLYPSPNESFPSNPVGLNPYAPQDNEPSCCITCWRMTDPTSSDPTIQLPPYIDRRTRKAYVLWKAFEAEGKGQLQRASSYYKKKYETLIGYFKSINEGCFVGKRYMVEDGMLEIDAFRYPKPILPSNFERIIFS